MHDKHATGFQGNILLWGLCLKSVRIGRLLQCHVWDIGMNSKSVQEHHGEGDIPGKTCGEESVMGR